MSNKFGELFVCSMGSKECKNWDSHHVSAKKRFEMLVQVSLRPRMGHEGSVGEKNHPIHWNSGQRVVEAQALSSTSNETFHSFGKKLISHNVLGPQSCDKPMRGTVSANHDTSLWQVAKNVVARMWINPCHAPISVLEAHPAFGRFFWVGEKISTQLQCAPWMCAQHDHKNVTLPKHEHPQAMIAMASLCCVLKIPNLIHWETMPNFLWASLPSPFHWTTPNGSDGSGFNDRQLTQPHQVNWTVQRNTWTKNKGGGPGRRRFKSWMQVKGHLNPPILPAPFPTCTLQSITIFTPWFKWNSIPLCANWWTLSLHLIVLSLCVEWTHSWLWVVASQEACCWLACLCRKMITLQQAISSSILVCWKCASSLEGAIPETVTMSLGKQHQCIWWCHSLCHFGGDQAPAASSLMGKSIPHLLLGSHKAMEEGTRKDQAIEKIFLHWSWDCEQHSRHGIAQNFQPQVVKPISHACRHQHTIIESTLEGKSR